MNLMEWSRCEKEFIRKVTPDEEKIRSIKEVAESRLRFVKTAEPTKENVSFIIEGYYEIIKELLSALMLKDGLKSKNHQCLITHFYRKNPDYEFEANLISQLSYLRNRLNYYGEAIDISFYNKNKEEIEKLIGILKERLEY
ncbi:MAG: hypothetical protein ABIA37_04865 [Candidatus Woesearchaeota archaeon]